MPERPANRVYRPSIVHFVTKFLQFFDMKKAQVPSLILGEACTQRPSSPAFYSGRPGALAGCLETPDRRKAIRSPAKEQREWQYTA